MCDQAALIAHHEAALAIGVKDWVGGEVIDEMRAVLLGVGDLDRDTRVGADRGD